MARRVALTLAYLGGLLFLLASAWTALGFELICLGGCDKSRIPELIVTMGLPYYGRLLLPGVAAMTIAWIICLAQLRRAQWSRMYRSVLFWPLLLAGLSGFGLVAVGLRPRRRLGRSRLRPVRVRMGDLSRLDGSALRRHSAHPSRRHHRDRRGPPAAARRIYAAGAESCTIASDANDR